MDRLKAALIGIDSQIAEMTRAANEQVRLIAGLAPGSRERDAAVVLLADLNRSLEAWKKQRGRLFDQLMETGQATPNGIALRETARRRLIGDARRWRLKAEELRTAASGMKTGVAAPALLRLAANYDLLAGRAETRAAQVRALKEGSTG